MSTSTRTAPLTDEQWLDYFDRLEGPEGCNFRNGEKGIAWDCAGGFDKTFSEKILTDMGFDADTVTKVLQVVENLGGHCDCEVLLNAEPRILG